MHTGEQYHAAIQASPHDRRRRKCFQDLALGLVAPGGGILDFGAGTGIDAKVYAANGHQTFVHEPNEAMRSFLVQYCREEVNSGSVVVVERPLACQVRAITANFAVLNHFADLAPLFGEFSRLLGPGGLVLASILNPYCLQDARYPWWRANIVNLICRGYYGVSSESGVYRIAPRVVARAAAPDFRLERVVPSWPGAAFQRYSILLLRRT